MRISFITTVFNEEKTVEKLLDSVLKQSVLPDEIIIVDGGSTDTTVERIRNQESGIKDKKIKLKLIIKKGNRSVGRNEAVRNANGDIIVCTDAGNILDKDWVKNITKPFMDSSLSGNDSERREVDVVAGYYKGLAKNVFQKCLIPYVLVMPDKADPENFLPATRSVAFRKSIWERAGKFDEKLSHNEDYAFSKKLKKIGANIVFQINAIVYWIPRNNLRQAFYMFFRFAYGDAEARIFRPKVIFVFVRYILGLALLIIAFFIKSALILASLLVILILYIAWAVQKNYNYVKNRKVIYFLPLLQFTADFAVISGTVFGLLKIWDIQKM